MVVARGGCDSLRTVTVPSGTVLVTEGGADCGHLVAVEDQVARLLAAQHVVDGDDAVGAGAAGVVDDGGVGLDPDPAPAPRHPAVVSTAGLTLVEH